MNDRSDLQLLRAYAESASEPAFRELVRRHADFVYSAALRQSDATAAADLAQGVFVDLARKAATVTGTPNGSLAGWLHRATRFAALNHRRDALRRSHHERQAMEQLLTDTGSTVDWESIRPALDEALDSLADEDREAILLRYFKNQDFRAVGLALGISDDTAQKRVSRAVDRLRDFFAQRKVTIGAGALTLVISANAIQAAPVGLAAAITTAALTGAAVTATTATTATVTKAIAMTTLQKIAITAAVAIMVGTGIYEAHQAAQLREENQSLRLRMHQLTTENEKLARTASESPATASYLAATPVVTNPPAPGLALTTPTNFWASLTNRMMTMKLTREQAEAYLSANGRNATSRGIL